MILPEPSNGSSNEDDGSNPGSWPLFEPIYESDVPSSSIGTDPDVVFMRMAVREAVRAAERDEVPVGAIIVHRQTEATREASSPEASISDAPISDEGDLGVASLSGSHAGRVIARASNQREMLRDPTAHAEMLAITQAAEALDRWRLHDTALYVTLEPCAMCAGAIVLARIPRVVFGAADPKAGACGSVLDILRTKELNHRPDVRGGVLGEECSSLLRSFFEEKRSQGKK